MSSCLSGGGRAYRLDLEIIKSPSTSWASNSSSPSSTLSESSNSHLSISTRKPRTPRKRPNQTYNEAAAILSTAYPKLFPTKHLTKPWKFTKSHDNSPFLYEPSELLIPFQVIDNPVNLLHPPVLVKPNSHTEAKELNSFEKPCQSPGEINSQGNNSSEICDEYQEDFDAESILDEEIEEGIDSIMGNLSMENNESIQDSSTSMQMNTCSYGYPVGLGFGFGYGMRRELRAMRNVDEGDWWRFPSVDLLDINQKIAKVPVEKKLKKKNSEAAKKNSFPTNKENLVGKACSEESIAQPNAGLLLKLNYDNVLNAWSDKGSPFSGGAPVAESAGNDVQARLAQIDLFSENGGAREEEAIVLRYKEKRCTRRFSKKIRYQVKKVYADQRPRMKVRFVRTPNSPDDGQG